MIKRTSNGLNGEGFVEYERFTKAAAGAEAGSVRRTTGPFNKKAASRFMTIDRHFLETVPASIFVAAILYFRFRRRFQYSWGWRIVISAVLAVGTAPIIFPDMAGGFSVPHFFPMIMFLPAAFADPTLYSFAGIAAGLLDFVLPFVATLAFMVFLWFAFIRLMSRYEKPAA